MATKVQLLRDTGTDLEALARTPGSVPHRHGNNSEHTHPDQAHRLLENSITAGGDPERNTRYSWDYKVLTHKEG
jgi:hypothetical protein